MTNVTKETQKVTGQMEYDKCNVTHTMLKLQDNKQRGRKNMTNTTLQIQHGIWNFTNALGK